MNLSNSYFAIPNPLLVINRWMHPFRYQTEIEYNGNKLRVNRTARAERALRKRGIPLIVEMQLYYSCTILKRILFHEQSELPTQPVNDSLNIIFRPVRATTCDPVEFARNHPVAYEFTSDAAQNLHPLELHIDYDDGKWSGDFTI